MKALVYRGIGKKAVEDRQKPELQASGDAIIKMAKTTICGTDLHILWATLQAANQAVFLDMKALVLLIP